MREKQKQIKRERQRQIKRKRPRQRQREPQQPEKFSSKRGTIPNRNTVIFNPGLV